MINQYSVENFKIHKQSEMISFDGLTVFIGANNSGKTSMLQSIRALMKMTVSTKPVLYMPLEQIEELGSLKDTLNKDVSRNELLYYKFKLDLGIGKECLVSLGFGSSLTMKTWGRAMVHERAILRAFSLRFIYEDAAREFCFKLKDEETNLGVAYDMYERMEAEERWLEQVTLFAFLPVHGFSSIKDETLAAELREWMTRMMLLNEDNIRYLGPYRMIEKRAHKVDSSLMKKDGSNCAELLSMYGDTVIFDGQSTLREAFQEWTSKILGIEFEAKCEHEEYRLVTNEQGVEFEMNQIGFGNTQILPVILQVLLTEKNQILMIENPEVHLHPRWKAELVELFYFAVSHGVKLVIETQSLEIITRIRLNVKQNPQLKSVTKLYSFEKNGFESVITFVEIDKNGRLSVWPKDFLDEVVMEDNIKLV